MRQSVRSRVFTAETKNQIRWADTVAVGAAVEKQQKANRLAVPLLLVAGIGFVVLGGYLQRTTSTFLAKAVHAQGAVVDLAVSHSGSGDGHTYAAIVEFQVDGSTYRFTDSVGSNPPMYRRGDLVSVLYDPDRPRHARIDRGVWNRLLPTLVGGFGALLCSFGVWALVRRKPNRA
jgi:hypothetical protein